MRYLCVILSYIAQDSLLLPLNESPPYSSWSVASQLRIFGGHLTPLLIRFQYVNQYLSNTELIDFKTLLTCTRHKPVSFLIQGRQNMFPSMYYKYRSLFIFPKTKGIAQDRTWTNNPNIFSVLLYLLSYLSPQSFEVYGFWTCNLRLAMPTLYLLS